MSDEAIYEMLWDCKYCGQKKLLGLTHRFCASCGSPQDPGARYFPPDSEKVAVADHEFVGADVACPTCKTANSRRAKCCGQCGSPLDKAVEVRTKDDPAQGPPPPPASAQPGNFPWIPIAVVGGVLALIAIIVVALSFKKKAHLEVASLTWERTIAIETYGNDRRSGWCDELPSGSRELARRKEQRGSDQIADGQDCKVKRKDKGDGTFKETKECTPKYKSVPKWSDKCDYEVTAWKATRSLKSGGAKEAAPSWPAVPSLRSGTCLGCERAGARAESYIVTVRDTKTGASDDCKLDEPKWQSFKVGQTVVGNRGVVSASIDCASLSPK